MTECTGIGGRVEGPTIVVTVTHDFAHCEQCEIFLGTLLESCPESWEEISSEWSSGNLRDLSTERRAHRRQTLEYQPLKFRRRRRRATNPAAPVPNSSRDAGSGVGNGAAGAKS